MNASSAAALVLGMMVPELVLGGQDGYRSIVRPVIKSIEHGTSCEHSNTCVSHVCCTEESGVFVRVWSLLEMCCSVLQRQKHPVGCQFQSKLLILRN